MPKRPTLRVINLSLWFVLGSCTSWVGMGLRDVSSEAPPYRWNSEIGIYVYVIGCVGFSLAFGGTFAGWMYYRSKPPTRDGRWQFLIPFVCGVLHPLLCVEAIGTLLFWAFDYSPVAAMLMTGIAFLMPIPMSEICVRFTVA